MAHKSKHPKSKPPIESPATVRRRGFVIGILFALSGAAAIWFRPDAMLAYWRGKALAASDPVQAEELFLWSINARSGQYPAAQLAWAKLLVDQGQGNEALGCFSLIEDTSLCGVPELLSLSYSAEKAGLNLLHAKALVAANRKGPEQAEVMRSLIRLKLRNKDWPAVLQIADDLERLNPHEAACWDARGRSHLAHGQIEDSLSAFRTALGKTATSSEADRTRLELVTLLIRLGEAPAAREEFGRLTQSGQQTQAVRLQEVWLNRLEGQQAQALAIAEALAESAPNSTAARFAYAVLRLDGGQTEAAIRDLEWVVHAAPENLEAHYKLAVALKQAGQVDVATKHFERSRQLENARLKVIAKPTPGQTPPTNE